MWARAARALRRIALLLPLALTALALLLLPRPPPLTPAPAPRQISPSSSPKEPVAVENVAEESEESPNREGDEVMRRPWFMRGGEQRPWHTDDHPKLFPEDAPGEDRIVEQLMYTLPKFEEVPVKKILLANGLGAWGASGGRTEFIRNKCPVDQCSLTADSRDAATADAILFKDHHTPFNVRRPPSQIWILYYLECPYHTASLRPASSDVFNWTATYRRDSDIVAPYERWVYHDPQVTEKELDRNYAANKTKKVAWFVSNCHARNRRLQYARQLAKYIQVDIYGACGSHHCPRADPNCLEMLDREYKFYLAFENSNCRDYITEKFFVNGLQMDIAALQDLLKLNKDAVFGTRRKDDDIALPSFDPTTVTTAPNHGAPKSRHRRRNSAGVPSQLLQRHDILPIVMGARASEYAAVAPHNSYVHVEEFAGAEELAAYLRRLDQDDALYNSYFKWKGTGEFINTYFFCRVCAMVHANERRQRTAHYTDAQAWWREGTCTRGEWRAVARDNG